MRRAIESDGKTTGLAEGAIPSVSEGSEWDSLPSRLPEGLAASDQRPPQQPSRL